MGQYYLAVNLDKKEFLSPHKYDSGAKLMEHSWFENKLVRTIENLLSLDGKWKGDRIVWAGDYMDEKIFLEGFLSVIGDRNLYMHAHENFKEIHNQDYINESSDKFQYIINHTKNEFVDKTHVRDNDGWIHPLSILTSSGNGRGGGDYRTNSEDDLYVGQWAGDNISVSNEIPDSTMIEILPDFFE